MNIPSKYFTQRQSFAVLNTSSEGLEKLTHLRWVAVNFPAGWTHWYLAQIPENFPTLQIYPCGLSWCRLAGCDCSALPDRVHDLQLETETWALLQNLEKSWGMLLSLVAWHWTCLMAIRSFSRQAWEWEFSQRPGPHLKGVLTRTCVLALFSLAGLVPESQTCFYIYQNFWSPLGTATLCQWNHVLLIPCQCCIASSQPCQLTHCWGQQWRGDQPSPPASWVTQGPALVASPACSLVSFRQILPVLLLLQLTSIFVHFYLGSSSWQLLTALSK